MSWGQATQSYPEEAHTGDTSEADIRGPKSSVRTECVGHAGRDLVGVEEEAGPDEGKDEGAHW